MLILIVRLMIDAKQIYDWFKISGEEGGFVDGVNGLTGEEELEMVVIDGRFDLIELADYLNKSGK